MAFGFGGNKSKQSSSTDAQSTSTDFGTNIWGPQAGYLQNLYGNAQQLAGGPQMGGYGLGQAQQNAQLAQQGLSGPSLKVYIGILSGLRGGLCTQPSNNIEVVWNLSCVL